MKYQQIRPKIRSGDLLAWGYKSWRTWRDIKIQLVRFFTQSEYSHVGTAWVAGERVFVVEAVVPLVRIYPLSQLGDFYHLPLNAEWGANAERYALENVGMPYSELEAIQAFFKIPGSNSTFECAELACKIAAADGIDLGSVYTPTAVVEAALIQGATLVYVENETN